MDIKKYRDIVVLSESKDGKIEQEKLSFGRDDLAPVLSKQAIKYHYDGLAARYSERYNLGEGDPQFNYGGAVLHNIFFANLAAPKSSNQPSDASEELISEKYQTFERFKQAFEKEFMAAQGSNWIYMDFDGKLHTIHNHEYKKTMKIALLVDAWEHSWFTDYGPDKAKYLKNIWRIIDWTVVNDRLQGK